MEELILLIRHRDLQLGRNSLRQPIARVDKIRCLIRFDDDLHRDVHRAAADQTVVPAVIVIELEAEQAIRRCEDQFERLRSHFRFDASAADRAERLSIGQHDHTRATPGVAAVLTAADVPGHNLFGATVKDELLLVEKEAVFLGQPLAIIAAENAEALHRARKAAIVEMNELPPIFSINDAIAAGDFFGSPRKMSRGDVEAGFSQADEIIEGVLEIGGQEHFYLESQIAIAIPGEQGQMTIHSSTQHPSEVQMMTAEVLGVPFNHVVCICKRMGGGFGGKETQAAQPAMMAALLAARTKRPVRFVYSKDDDMRYTGKRHPFKAIYKAGFTSDGRITSVDVRLYSNGGCSTDLSFAVLERAMLHLDNAYFLPNVRIEGRVCRTNLPSNTAFRGFGGPQAVAVIENLIEEIAARLKIVR
jgi:xanthine dehydrogenase large subunit